MGPPLVRAEVLVPLHFGIGAKLLDELPLPVLREIGGVGQVERGFLVEELWVELTEVSESRLSRERRMVCGRNCTLEWSASSGWISSEV